MTIDDLKSLMDEFDPAALLPELDSVVSWIGLAMRVLVLVGPAVLLVMGLVYLLAAPKEANYYLGYRCYYGMGSVEAWRFTQRLAGIVWGALGLVLLVVMIVVSNGFADLSTADAIWSAGRCVLWQAALALVSCLFINSVVAINFTSGGEYRRKKEEVS